MSTPPNNNDTSESNLSADAKCFVPGKYKGGGQEDKELPSYVTSCYPFVQEGSRSGSNAPRGPSQPLLSQPRQMHPNILAQQHLAAQHAGAQAGIMNLNLQRYLLANGQRFFPPQPSGARFMASPQPTGPRFIPPQPMSTQPTGPRFIPPQPMTSPLLRQPTMLPHSASSVIPIFPPGTGAMVRAGGFIPGGPAMLPFGHGMPAPPTQITHEYAYPQNHYQLQESKKKTKKSEGTSTSDCACGTKKKTQYMKPKTIICMDAALQTDFADNIKNLTLVDKPHPLYSAKKPRTYMEHYQQQAAESDTAEEEEVDSDSGYSSPLHRRNQGTHQQSVITGATPYAFQPQPTLPLTVYHTNPYAGTYTSIPQNPMAAPIVESTTMSYARAVTNPVANQSVVSDSQSIVNAHGLHSTPASSNQPGRALTRPCAIPIVPPESKKKKKNRNKSTKAKNASKESSSAATSDIEALSDDPTRGWADIRSSEEVSVGSDVPEVLHFDDDNEFPNLLNAADRMVEKYSQQPSLTYSDILRNQLSPLSQESSLSLSTSSEITCKSSTTVNTTSDNGKIDSKNARKRRRRLVQLNKAADKELAEISIEQQVLKEISTKVAAKAPKAPKTPPPKKPSSREPMALDLSEMLSAMQKKEDEKKKAAEKTVKKEMHFSNVNPLDSSAPVKRGKEREVPKLKKPSPLKKVILKEREEKRRLRLLEEGIITEQEYMLATDPAEQMQQMIASVTKMGEDTSDVAVSVEKNNESNDESTETVLSPSLPVASSEESGEAVERKYTIDQQVAAMTAYHVTKASFPLPLDDNLSAEMGSKTSSQDLSMGTSNSADMSPISQTSPISMSPFSASPMNSPVANLNYASTVGSVGGVESKIHSRRYREYCKQVLDVDIDQTCTKLLQDLVRFQDRLYHKDPTRLRGRRRFVLGLREVTKHLKLKKLRCVIISPNLERIQSKGGLDEALNNIMDMCQEQKVPFVFALGRRALGRACAKLVPVSVVGIFNYEGSEENFHKLIELTQKAQNAYMEMISILEKDKQETPATSNTSSVFPIHLAHMGHSRTPSACSAISFTSSILSEPISENYPHSEPETDSRGYEIVEKGKERAEDVSSSEEPRSDSPSSIAKADKNTDLSDYEGDNEDDDHHSCVRNESYGKAQSGIFDECHLETADEFLQALPHFDSIHSSIVDLSTEFLSQHSSKTIELNMEVLSTHSSKTMEGNPVSGGRTTPDHSSRNTGSATDLREASTSKSPISVAGGNGTRAMDKARIETWVAETQRQVECMSVNGVDGSEDEEVDEEIEVDEHNNDISDEDEGLDFTDVAPVNGTSSTPKQVLVNGGTEQS